MILPQGLLHSDLIKTVSGCLRSLSKLNLRSYRIYFIERQCHKAIEMSVRMVTPVTLPV